MQVLKLLITTIILYNDRNNAIVQFLTVACEDGK